MADNKKGLLLVKGAIVGAGMASVAGATVFILPTDVDQYKAKTDQTFYDAYQNKDSMIAGGINPAAQKILKDSGIKSGNRILDGAILDRPNTTILAGTTLRAGANPVKFRLPIPGSPSYTLTSSKDTGKATIHGTGASGATISLTGTNAISKSGNYCINSGKSGCYVFAQDRTNVYYNAFSGELRRDRVQYSANGLGCGKYGSGCYAPGEASFAQNKIKQSRSSFYSIEDLYKQKYQNLNDIWPKGKDVPYYGDQGRGGHSGKYSS